MWRVSESRTDTANRLTITSFGQAPMRGVGVYVGDLPTRHLSCTTPGQAGPLTH